MREFSPLHYGLHPSSSSRRSLCPDCSRSPVLLVAGCLLLLQLLCIALYYSTWEHTREHSIAASLCSSNSPLALALCPRGRMSLPPLPPTSPSVPVLILQPNLSRHAMDSIWQARQSNPSVHVLYDPRGTAAQACSGRRRSAAAASSASAYDNCTQAMSSLLSGLSASLSPHGVELVDLYHPSLHTGVDEFLRLFSIGNNKTLFDLRFREKWEYERWCAVRWLYAHNYAVSRNFTVVYVQDSDVMLYADVTREYGLLSPMDVAFMTSVLVPNSSGHSVIFTLTALRALLDWMLATWRGRTFISAVVLREQLTDMFYFYKFFSQQEREPDRRPAQGLIVRSLLDPYFDSQAGRRSARFFDMRIADDDKGRYDMQQTWLTDDAAAAGAQPSNFTMKAVRWLPHRLQEAEDSGGSGAELQWQAEPSMSRVLHPYVRSRDLQQMLYVCSLHFQGPLKRFMHRYRQRQMEPEPAIDQLVLTVKDQLPRKTLN